MASESTDAPDAPPGLGLGRMFAEAFAAKDFERIAELLDPEVDFRGLTPRRTWLRGHNEDGPFTFEQRAYFTERDGRIDWMRVLCSGFRPPA